MLLGFFDHKHFDRFAAWRKFKTEAMSRLGKTDRDAVILRFFKKKSLREVAAAIQVIRPATARADSRLHRQ